MPGEGVGEDLCLARVVWIADIIHVAFRGSKPSAIFSDDIRSGVGAMLPDRRRRARNVQDYVNSAGVEFGHELIPPGKLELALEWLE